ncbi:hypothetical protein PS925_06178 [Pseudomonas fluorescens]|uniref:Uncharacterized protein n=1 Tax=Pseudomonas fluorescens TaxID=294 RepID=A0A5E7VTY7_PSEFL|nr:hypothetical protein PS925_06178 [Pseudomonas fluorescens]
MRAGLDYQRAFSGGAAVAADTEQVVGADHRVARPVGGVAFVSFDQAGAVVVDLFKTVATDLAVAVIEDQLFEITLGAQVDFLLAGAVFDHQFVVAAGVR